ncbi:MAG: DoxX family protein [Planctomycetia bacterium]
MFRLLEYLTLPVGRLFLSLIFLLSAINKMMNWSHTADLMRGEGMKWVPFFLIMAVIVEIGGGLSVLLGVKARLGALALLIFLLPVTLIFHDFWQYADLEQTMQMIHFLKNLAIMGGLLVLLGHGAGPISYDSLRHRVKTKLEKKGH